MPESRFLRFMLFLTFVAFFIALGLIFYYTKIRPEAMEIHKKYHTAPAAPKRGTGIESFQPPGPSGGFSYL